MSGGDGRDTHIDAGRESGRTGGHRLDFDFYIQEFGI